jgi:hypothetical protein
VGVTEEVSETDPVEEQLEEKLTLIDEVEEELADGLTVGVMEEDSLFEEVTEEVRVTDPLLDKLTVMEAVGELVAVRDVLEPLVVEGNGDDWGELLGVVLFDGKAGREVDGDKERETEEL